MFSQIKQIFFKYHNVRISRTRIYTRVYRDNINAIFENFDLKEIHD